MPPATVGRDPGDVPHERLVERVRRALLRRGAPRLQMAAVVALTGACGLGASVALRRAGLHHMGVRYGLAVAAAYGAFLSLLGAWLLVQRRRRRGDGSGGHRALSWLDVDAPSGGGGGSGSRWGGGGRLAPRWTGGGGSSGGGGATGSIELRAASPGGDGIELVARAHPRGGLLGRVCGGVLDGLDDDAVVAIVLTLLAALSGLAAAAYVVYAAPLLLADVLVDGTLSAGLYRRLRRGHEHAWWEGAVRRTALPAAVVLVAFTAAGFALHHAWPGAATLGEAWRALVERR